MTCCGKTVLCRAPGRIRAEQVRHEKSAGGRHRTAVLKIVALMLKEEIDDAPPEPRGRIDVAPVGARTCD
jgi:hypothetical protein